jgi:hypothetical protein
MDQYRNDIANNIIALAGMRAKDDPQQLDSEIFKAYFVKTLAPAFKDAYVVGIKYDSFDRIIAQAKKVLT